MARPLRIQGAGLAYHVWSRGSGGIEIYLDDRDREKFLEFFECSLVSHCVVCHAFCLMSNHYHAVITTNQPNLSHAMQQIDSPYAEWWNGQHSRRGHVFQGRFGAQLIQSDTYLLTACRYVVLNPVRAGIVSTPDEWRWSSYRATAGLEPVPVFLHPETLWNRLGSDRWEGAICQYRQFVGTGDHMPNLPHAAILGDEAFVESFKDRRKAASREVPKRDRRTFPPLSSFFGQASTLPARASGASEAHSAGYSLREIARFLDVHHTTVTKMIARNTSVGSHRQKA